ncbi:metallophosphoesterase [Legionella jamestowniensis]|uniref:Calcineurin-like phosphoesterase n=1 Tax=Legionella jamestowniensis TaxID=455 RepID=A0A0W0UH81_9GAMM|nr:metallophosphoesterase [Legionella jamestowniensis]KTD07268.1 Calcineurin-like phosphoesterase [Legionella jamestowniensis]SFL95402.1 Calcineurin-like phosphoesterase [Legionella jamestowniensis DSM 19215]
MFRAVYRRSVGLNGRRISTSVLHITDSEGHYPSFANSIARSHLVEFDKHGQLTFQPSAVNPFFVYGGDLTDRGPGDVKLLKQLLSFKKRYPDRVFLLAGNREASKTRFHTELHPKYIRERLINGTAPYWLQSRPHTIPSDYVKKHMLKKGKSAQGHTELIDYIQSLNIEECQLIYLNWMLEENLGCSHTFAYHAQELATQLGKRIDEISEGMILNSIIEMTSPNGLIGDYLKHAQVAAIIPNTEILVVHGGLTPINIGRIPGMIPTDEPISNARLWISQFNCWFRAEVKKWADSCPGELPLQLRAASSPLDTFSMNIPAPFRTIVTASMLDDNRKFISIPPEVSTYLTKNKISLVLTGHQPCGDHPAILRSDDDQVVFINGDTGYANTEAKDPHDTRGPVTHTLQIFSGLDDMKIDIDARLLNEGRVSTKLKMAQGKVVSQHYVGKLLPGNELVQCQLKNGNYRIVHQEDFIVRYKEMTPDEVEQKLNLTPLKRNTELTL